MVGGTREEVPTMCHRRGGGEMLIGLPNTFSTPSIGVCLCPSKNLLVGFKVFYKIEEGGLTIW
jgi:hypothetical protein